MSEIDQKQFEDLIKALRDNTGALGRIAAKSSNNNGRKNAADHLERDLKTTQDKYFKQVHKVNEATEHTTEMMTVLSGKLDHASAALSKFARAIPGGALIGSMVGWTKTAIDTWRQVSEVGQNFNGSIFSMAKAAADAGLPLDEFAETIKKNSKTVATYGQKEVLGMMKSVRKVAEQNGLYGYTIDGLNQVTGEYLETQRLYANKSAASNKRSLESVNAFAKEVGALANTTGKSREEILGATMKAMRDVALTSRMIGMSGADVDKFSDSTMKAVGVLASLPDEAGDVFATFLSQSAGYGTALFSDAAEDFIKAGLGQMIGATDQLSAALEKGGDNIDGVTWEYIDDFKKQVEANRDSLRVQAMAGNESAKKMLRMYSQVANLDKKKYEDSKKQQEQTKSLTAFLGGISSALKRIFGSVMKGLFGGLEDIEGKMDKLMDSPTFHNMEKTFEALGSQIGEFFRNMKPEQIKEFADGIGAVATGFMGLLQLLGNVGRGFMSLMSWVHKLFGPKGDFIALITAAFAPAVMFKILQATFFKIVEKLAPTFANFWSEFRGKKVGRMSVKADIVSVNGDGGGSGGGGGGDDLGGGDEHEHAHGHGRKGAGTGKYGSKYGTGAARRAKAMEILRARKYAKAGKLGKAWMKTTGAIGKYGGKAMRGLDYLTDLGPIGGALMKSGVGKAMLKGAGKIGLEGAAKMLVKKVPILGAIAGLGFGAQRLFGDGDWKGAGLEVLSGLASTLPGIGTVASLGIDGALMARDVVGRDKFDKGVGDFFTGKKSQSAAPSKQEYATRDIDARTAKMEQAIAEANKTGQTDPRVAQLEQMQKEIKGIHEAQLALMKEHLEVSKKNVKVNSTVASALT